jgi:hypothetical protein
MDLPLDGEAPDRDGPLGPATERGRRDRSGPCPSIDPSLPLSPLRLLTDVMAQQHARQRVFACVFVSPPVFEGPALRPLQLPLSPSHPANRKLELTDGCGAGATADRA